MKHWTLIFLSLLLTACSHEPDALQYGRDSCEFCKMTIMDQKFGAELINKNGKKLKFDSGECMLRFLSSDHSFTPEVILVGDYAAPGTLIDASQSFYLHGGAVSSPMGGQLAAFKTRQAAEQYQKEVSGDVLLWPDVSKLRFP